MKKILILEDEQNLRELYRQVLQEGPYQVFTAADGKKALETIKKNDIELIVLDIRLEDESGLDVMRQIMDHQRDIKVVINTAYPSFKADFNTWCADAYLIKSSDFDELKSTISNLLTE